MTSLSVSLASPLRLLTLKRRHWAIENKLHYCRDLTFHEDAGRLASGTASQAIAVLNNLGLGRLPRRRFTSLVAARRRSLPLVAARRRFNALPAEALALIPFI
ncbi:MAG: hypothetical protein ABI947_25190 [Chloroflexota bacterium]